MAAPARRRTLPRRTSPCPSNTPSARCINFLTDEGVRDKVTLIASGGIRSAHDIAKAIALGADGVVIGTAELVALGCVRCSLCASGRGCPRGIATTDPELCGKMDLDWGTQRLINLYSAWRKTLVGILQRLGLRSVAELRGRTDLLMHLDAPGLHQRRAGKKMNSELIQRLAGSRKRLAESLNYSPLLKKEAEEGGCGVVGFCCSEPVAGRHIYEPSRQMHNRGNGKGGGIAAVGLVPEQLGVSREVLDTHCLLHVAFIDTKVRAEIEEQFIKPFFDIAASAQLDKVADWKSVPGLEVLPPDVCRYFVRVKPAVLDAFIAKNRLEKLERDAAEDEFVSQNSFSLNQKYYASLGEKRAFVLSHGRDIMILKVVGYAEAIVKYYKIEELCAHVWIAHQRFPTKGRVWHPGGAHPFAATDMALVHNGDFANYHSVTEYLKQRHIYPQFLTDTEVSALLFDLLTRTYHYPLEYIIEALAPTTELDFDRLDPEKQKIYRAIQATHIHGSPDGPWFFIIARNLVRQRQFQLMGITDTAMLRPQVFAFCDGEVQVGLIASEKQAIDATLLSLSKDDNRICPVADRYWNARGGSHNDGGAFIFNLQKNPAGKIRIACTDKFGKPVPMPGGTEPAIFPKKELR
jgi:glutamate synthase domain-containing protein 1